MAMGALQNVVQKAYDVAEHCKKQIDALWKLLQSFVQRQWSNILNTIKLFNRDIGEPLWTLGKAVRDRDWPVAGQQVAILALGAQEAYGSGKAA